VGEDGNRQTRWQSRASLGNLVAMRRIEVVGEKDEGIAQWEGEHGIKRAPDGAIVDVGTSFSKAFATEMDAISEGVRGGGNGADADLHAAERDAWERAEVEFLRQVEAEVVARAPARARVKAARVTRGKWVQSDEDAPRQRELMGLAWDRAGRVVGEFKMLVDGGVERVLREGKGQGFLNVLVSAMMGRRGRGVVLGA
jgi:hypothetical protein